MDFQDYVIINFTYSDGFYNYEMINRLTNIPPDLKQRTIQAIQNHSKSKIALLRYRPFRAISMIIATAITILGACLQSLISPYHFIIIGLGVLFFIFIFVISIMAFQRSKAFFDDVSEIVFKESAGKISARSIFQIVENKRENWVFRHSRCVGVLVHKTSVIVDFAKIEKNLLESIENCENRQLVGKNYFLDFWGIKNTKLFF